MIRGLNPTTVILDDPLDPAPVETRQQRRARERREAKKHAFLKREAARLGLDWRDLIDSAS